MKSEETNEHAHNQSSSIETVPWSRFGSTTAQTSLSPTRIGSVHGRRSRKRSSETAFISDTLIKTSDIVVWICRSPCYCDGDRPAGVSECRQNDDQWEISWTTGVELTSSATTWVMGRNSRSLRPGRTSTQSRPAILAIHVCLTDHLLRALTLTNWTGLVT